MAIRYVFRRFHFFTGLSQPYQAAQTNELPPSGYVPAFMPDAAAHTSMATPSGWCGDAETWQ